MIRNKRKRSSRENAARIAAATYPIGWGKPPIENRFKKGEPQNFSRKKKPIETFETIIQKLSSEKLSADINGSAQKLSALEYTFRLLRKLAFSGNMIALRMWLELLDSGSPQSEHSIDYSVELRAKIEKMARKYEEDEKRKQQERGGSS